VSANAIDAHIGARLSARRAARGIGEGALAEMTGVCVRAIRRYERGARRIGAAHLFAFAKALDVEIGYFFEGSSGSPDPPRERA